MTEPLTQPLSPRVSDAEDWTAQKSRHGWYVVGVLLIAWVLAYLDRGIINLLAQSLKTQMQLSDTQLSLIQGFAFSMPFALAGLPLGLLVDRSNRRNIIIAGVLVWSLATFACGLANSFETLMAARMFVGIGEACLAPAAFSIVADLFPPSRRGRAMGVMMAGSAIGNAASIFIGGLLLLLLGSAAVALPILGVLTPAQLTFVLISIPGILVAGLLLTFREPPRLSYGAMPTPIDGGSGPSITAYVWKHRRVFGLVYGLLVCNFILAQTSGTWVPVILMRLYGMTPGSVGMWLGTIILVVGPAFGFFGGFLADRFVQTHPHDGRLRVALISFPISLIFVAGYIIEDMIAVLVVYAGLAAFGNLLVGASYSALHDLVPASLRGRVVAVLLFITSSVGYGLGTTLVALVTDLVFHDEARVQDSLLVILAPTVVLGMVLALLALKPYAKLRAELIDAAK